MLVVIVLVLVVAVAAVAAGVYYYRAPGSSGSNGCSDPDDISSHVYNPYRLQQVQSCITASGTVDNVLSENDGDYHIRLKLDAQYSNLTNSGNQQQYGDLVVEVICATTITQADAVGPCQGYTNKIQIPSIGQHITVTGPYVLDTDHSYWAEIHPVYTLGES